MHICCKSCWPSSPRALRHPEDPANGSSVRGTLKVHHIALSHPSISAQQLFLSLIPDADPCNLPSRWNLILKDLDQGRLSPGFSQGWVSITAPHPAGAGAVSKQRAELVWGRKPKR